jgi:hypothetical protein
MRALPVSVVDRWRVTGQRHDDPDRLRRVNVQGADPMTGGRVTHRWNVLLVVLMVCAAAVGLAQTRQAPSAVTTAPDVLSGENVGVRVIGPPDKNGRVPGAIMVKINGRWVEVVSPVTPKLITK